MHTHDHTGSSTMGPVREAAVGRISIRRSTLLLYVTGAFAAGTMLAQFLSRSVRRVQRYIESRGSNGGRRPVILLFGDSITQGGNDPQTVGWASRLADMYQRKADLLNRGFSGYNTAWLLKMLPDLFSRFFRRRPPALVTIWLGANDAALPPSQQHVPLDAYKENLEEMVRYFRRLGTRHREVAVLLITPPPFHEQDWEVHLQAKHGGGAGTDRLHEVSRAYGDAVIEVGKSEKVPVVDMYAALEGPKGPDAYRPYLSDGLHLSLEGNRKAFEAVAAAIRNNYPWLDPVSLEAQGPDWSELKSDYDAIPLYSSKSSIISLDRL